MRKSSANRQRTAPSPQSRSRGVTLAPVLFITAAVLGIIVVTLSWHAATAHGPGHAATARDSGPPKPQGTQSNNPPATQSWTVAKGLPSQVMRLAFSAADATRGYAAVFVNKQTQALYATTDSGMSWHQSGTVQGPVGDFVSVDPRDPQDVVMLSVYAPTPGAYTFQRSLDGGQTWSTQSADLSTTGMVSQTGWSDSTFLVGFQLDGQLQGSSALVAFPKGQASFHLDVNGKIDGAAIAHLHLLTGHGNRIQVWGDDGSQAQNIIGVATADAGKHWASLPSPVPGSRFMPTAATDDGGTLVAVSADNTRIAISGDGGNTWVVEPSFASAQQQNRAVFVTAKSKRVVVTRGGGSYALQSGMWSRVTSKQVVNVSDSGTQSAARLWSYDAQGHVIWLDD